MPPKPSSLRREVRRLLRGALADPLSTLDLPARELDLSLRMLRRANLLGRFACRVRDTGRLDALPEQLADLLLSAIASAESRVHVGLWELDRIAWAMEDDPDTPLIAMKGCAYLLAGTPNASGRSFGDVDLLAPQGSLSSIEQRLLAHGWQSAELSAYDEHYYRHWAHELPPLSHRERGVEVDLHHNILMRTARLRPPAALLLAAARPIAGSRFHVLAPIDMTLHAMTHLFFSGEMEDGLRELVDVADLLAHFGSVEPDFWNQFWARTMALDLSRPAFYGLRYARAQLGAPVPDSVIEQSQTVAPPRPLLALMDRLIGSAIYPSHPDVAETAETSPASRLLFLRQHWIRMPPTMLARHLATKFWLRLQDRQAA